MQKPDGKLCFWPWYFFAHLFPPSSSFSSWVCFPRFCFITNGAQAVGENHDNSTLFLHSAVLSRTSNCLLPPLVVPWFCWHFWALHWAQDQAPIITIRPGPSLVWAVCYTRWQKLYSDSFKSWDGYAMIMVCFSKTAVVVAFVITWLWVIMDPHVCDLGFLHLFTGTHTHSQAACRCGLFYLHAVFFKNLNLLTTHYENLGFKFLLQKSEHLALLHPSFSIATISWSCRSQPSGVQPR